MGAGKVAWLPSPGLYSSRDDEVSVGREQLLRALHRRAHAVLGMLAIPLTRNVYLVKCGMRLVNGQAHSLPLKAKSIVVLYQETPMTSRCENFHDE